MYLSVELELNQQEVTAQSNKGILINLMSSSCYFSG